MIIDRLKNCKKYYSMNPRLEEALNYLKATDFTDMPVGRYEVKGSDIVALVQEFTTETEETKPVWEYHKYHLDIQWIISGEEQIGYHPVENLVPNKPYDPAGDHIHCEDVEGDYLTLKDDRIIITPDDGHRPHLCVGKPGFVKKVVLKIVI